MEALVGPSRELVEYVAKIGEGFDAIELTGLDQGIEGRCSLATSVVAGKEVISTTDGYAPQCALHRVVIDAQSPLLKIEGEHRPTLQCIGDGLGNGALGSHLHLYFGEPGMEGFQ